MAGDILEGVEYEDVTGSGLIDEPDDEELVEKREELKPLSKRSKQAQFRILKAQCLADQDSSAKWRRQAGDDFGFVAGDQLSSEDKELLNAQQRPHVVFNRVQTILKAVRGMEINGRNDIAFIPRNTEDTESNEILSAGSDWMGQGCDAVDEQSAAFEDCAITGMGWCLSDNALVRLPNTHFATTRLYSGRVITIDLENGKHLTGTPNHPVLTSLGWKRLHELKEGDNLINSAFMNEVGGLPVHQFDNVESRLDDKMNAFRASGKAARFTSRPADFYGDGAGSKVHVVYANGFLGDQIIDASRRERRSQSGFVGRNMFSSIRAFLSGERLSHHARLTAKRLFSFGWGHFPRFDFSAFGVGSQGVASRPQSGSKGPRVHAKNCADFVGREFFHKIHVDNFLNRVLRFGAKFGVTPKRIAAAHKPVSNGALSYSSYISDFFDWKPVLEMKAGEFFRADALSTFYVRVQKRVINTVENFAVHDVGTSVGFFIAGDVITSNTECRFSYFEEVDGKYIEENIDCREMIWDRRASKKNLVDARRMFRVRKMPMADAIPMFPGKTKQQMNADWIDGIGQSNEVKSIEEKRIRDGEGSYSDDDYDDGNEVTVVCAQWWEPETFWLVGDDETGERHELNDHDYKAFSLLYKVRGFPMPESVEMTRKVFKQAFLGSEYLKGGPAPAGNQFSWACMTGEYDKKNRTFYGLVKVVRDPQMWANKFMSQVMYIMNSTAKGGILAETDAFDDERDAEDGYASSERIVWMTPGALSGSRPKVMPKPGQGDASSFVNLLQFAVSSIKDVTGINLELLGQQDQNQPGILEHMRKQAGMTTLATLFDSKKRFLQKIGRIRLHFLQTRMSDGRLIRVVGNQYDIKAVALARENTTGSYDVVVDDAPTSPNQKEANWAIIQPMLGVFKDQLMQNPQVLVMVLQYSPLPSPLVNAISKVILQAANDPKMAAEAEQMKQIGMARMMATIAKEQSAADLNKAKAGTAQATAVYDMAIAKNLMDDNARAGTQDYIKTQEAAAKAAKVGSDAELTTARAARERVGTHLDVMQTKAKFDQMNHDRGMEVNLALTDRVAAHAKSQADMATALRERVLTHLAVRQSPAVGQ